MTDADRLVVGAIVKPHGIRGEVAVEVYSDAPDRFAPGSVLRTDRGQTLTVAAARPHQGRLLVRFEEVPDRNGAEALRRTELTIPITEAAPLADGAFYEFQLVGCDVVDDSGISLGTMVRVEENPANDLWVVRARGREVLVPAVKEIVLDVDLENRRIVLSPPEGLFG